MLNDAECKRIRSNATCLPECHEDDGTIIPSCSVCRIYKTPAKLE